MASSPPSGHTLPSGFPKINTHRLDIDILEPVSSNTSRPRRVWSALPKFQMQRPRLTTNLLSEERNPDVESSPLHPDRPPIPSALASSTPQGAYSTPLPVLPMVVLSITMLGEFLSANVSTPFLLFMVEGFLIESDAGADAGYWTGILVSMFFLSQFLTSLLWATVAERHGSRSVLFISLLGSAFTCTIFGTSQSLKEAIVVRLLQGIFAGSMGVARSTIANITDGSNEGRAYAILGFAWGLGGVAGAIIGGTFVSPAQKWPDVFSRVPIFVKYPYLLPCMIASSVTLIGAILSLFLARDGGPRSGAIRLPDDKEDIQSIPEEDEIIDSEARIRDDNASITSQSVLLRLPSAISTRLSRVFSKQGSSFHQQNPLSSSADHVPLAAGNNVVRPAGRMSFRSSRATGSAYGYGASRVRNPSDALGGRRFSMASSLHKRRAPSGDMDTQHSTNLPTETPNFAQRLLMANERAVTNIADLWVAAAMNVDNEEVFLSDDETEHIDEEIGIRRMDDIPQELNESTETSDLRNSADRPTIFELAHTTRNDPPPRHPSSMAPSLSSAKVQTSIRTRHPHLSDAPIRAQLDRTLSKTFSTTSSQIPSIYANTGLRAPPGMSNEGRTRVESERENNVPVPESLRQRQLSAQQPPSAFKQLPFMIIMQYGLLALHSTTHDQVFLSYLVSKYDVGGLGLLAGNFAQLIAVMSLAQIVYQFYLYPNIGPPRGRFSHLSMFRVGALLFIPAYLSVPIYRSFTNADGDGNFLVMTMLIISTSIRFCGSTFGYTAIAILLNYVSPPHIIGLANGLAQSIVSFARFAGPILGGYLWSLSVQDNPGGYPLGFFFCAGICAAAILLSFLIR